jgi:hypothetical protein
MKRTAIIICTFLHLSNDMIPCCDDYCSLCIDVELHSARFASNLANKLGKSFSLSSASDSRT